MTDKVTRANPYGGGGIRYLEILTAWRDDDRLDGLNKIYEDESPVDTKADVEIKEKEIAESAVYESAVEVGM